MFLIKIRETKIKNTNKRNHEKCAEFIISKCHANGHGLISYVVYCISKSTTC